MGQLDLQMHHCYFWAVFLHLDCRWIQRHSWIAWICSIRFCLKVFPMKPIALLLIPSAVLAFFHFFEDQHQEQQPKKEKVEEITCLGRFECPSTKTCVDHAIDCPCGEQQTKCLIGDWYLCVSGHQSCKSFA